MISQSKNYCLTMTEGPCSCVEIDEGSEEVTNHCCFLDEGHVEPHVCECGYPWKAADLRWLAEPFLEVDSITGQTYTDPQRLTRLIDSRDNSVWPREDTGFRAR